MTEHRCAYAVVAAGFCAAFCALAGGTALADPAGQWLVADRSAVMKIEACGDGYYASIDWERVPGIDAKNPDPAKRGRPLAGISIVMSMKPSGTDEWEGRVYNPKDGKTYPAQMSQPRPDQVRIEGCVLGGLICDGETWTRVPAATTGAAPVDDKSYCPK
jgi:uncharacterized protein (DUF2147 family)